MAEIEDRAKSIFLAALERAPEQWPVFLAEACGEDAELRARVEQLLDSHRAMGSIHGGAVDATVAGSASPRLEAPGSVIGPYTLVEQLGEGGFGVVFLAEQLQPVRRKVALKVLKPGLDTCQVVTRFEAERHALALMDHPNIARVLDGGETTTGRPYFVMELVNGVSITKYCDDNRLAPRERLALFVAVCEAVQHAHQKGIIHRDIKPSNVMVAEYDGRPVPKVIDFGVAKAVGQKLSERTFVTGLGGIIGTLEYMSPEQAEFNASDIDTRADVYGLGVLLYELLTGTTPLTKQQLKESAITEVLRIIREEEPQTPSTRLSSSVDSLAAVSAQRKTEPGRLTKEVRGELDWIVMRCLEKDRARRYNTANGLARDIQRYLNDEVVDAGPPSASYRLRKFTRKHRKLLGVAGGFALLLAVGAAVSTWQAIRATRAESVAAEERNVSLAEKERANEEAAIAKAVNEFLQVDLLGQSDIANQPAGVERNKDIKVRELLDRAAQAIGKKFQGQELTEAGIRLTLGRAYRALGEYGEAQKHLERSRDLRQQKLGVKHLDTLESIKILGALFSDRAQYRDAEQLLKQVMETARSEFGPEHSTTLAAMNDLATLQFAQGRWREAETLHKQLLDYHRAHSGDKHPQTLNCMENVALNCVYQSRFDEAEPLLKRVLEARTAQQGVDHPRTLTSMTNLATLYRNWGRPEDAEPLFKSLLDAHRARLGPNDRRTLQTMNNLAMLYADTQRYDDAESLLKEALQASGTKLGADHPNTLLIMHNLGYIYWLGQRNHEAEQQFKQALSGRRARLSLDHPETVRTLQNLGVAIRDQGRYDEAEPLLKEAFALSKNAFGPGHEVTLGCVGHLAMLHQKRGTQPLAEPLLRETVSFLRTQGKADSNICADLLGCLSQCLLDQKKYAEAESIGQECFAIRRAKNPDAWTTFNAQSLLGNVFLSQKKFAEAEPLLLGGYQGMKKRETKIPNVGTKPFVQSLERLVELYVAWGKEAEAARWRKELEEEKARMK